MSLFSPLLVIAFDEEGAKRAANLAAAIGYPDAHITADGFNAAASTLRLRQTSPDYLLIDVGARGTEMLPLLDEFAHHCDPKLRVAVVGDRRDSEFYQALKKRGVLEYFSMPALPDDVRRLLIMGSAGSRVENIAVDMPGMVVSCMGATAGDGASTVAVNLASALANESGQPVVLVDMDYQFGMISRNLDLVAPFGIRELFDHPGRGLDHMLVGKMLVEYKPNLSIIAAPAELHLLPSIRPEQVRELLALLRTRFAYVVLDIPHVWTEWTAAALTYSHINLMVAQLWLRSLTHATRLLSAWHAVGIAREAVMLAVNRHGAKYKEAIAAEDFERICRRKIDAVVGNDIKAITQAENNARTLFESDIATPLCDQITALARAVMAKNALPQGAATPSADKKSLLSPRFKK